MHPPPVNAVRASRCCPPAGSPPAACPAREDPDHRGSAGAIIAPATQPLRPPAHRRVSGLNTASPVDSILDKDNFTLEELLDEDELIQECKSLNARLTAFLKKKETVQKLVRRRRRRGG